MPIPVSGSHSAATLPPEDQFQPPPLQPQQTQTYNDTPDPAEYVAKPSRPTGAYAAPPVAPPPKPVAPAPSPVVAAAAATTPQQAYNAIKTIPVPDNADMTYLSPVIQSAMMGGRAEAFNQTRLDAAQAALEHLRPQRSDYAGLPTGTAEALHQTACAKFESDPYARELSRIVDEAKTGPQEIPAYLLRSESTARVDAIPQDRLGEIMGHLGIYMPSTSSPEFASEAVRLLGALPDPIVAAAVNLGMQVSFSGGPAVGGQNILGPRVDVGAKVEGKVELSDAETGIDFVQTQQFKMSVEARAEVKYGYENSGFRKIIDILDKIPGPVQEFFNRSPVLGSLIKGLPVAVSGSTFEGKRLSYEAVVPPEIGNRLDEGDLSVAPNPLQPLSMPIGSSVLMRGHDLRGSELEVAAGLFKGGFEAMELSGSGFGVTRIDEAMVEVYSGSMIAVESAAHVGPKKLPVSLSIENSDEVRNLHVARIDLSTEEGRETYQFFMRTGIVPEWAPPGVPQSGTRDAFAGERTRSSQLKHGGLELGFTGGSNGFQAESIYADGSRDCVSTYSSEQGTVSEVKMTLDSSGEARYETASWVIMRTGVDPVSANYYADAVRPGNAADPLAVPQDIQTSYTTAELLQPRQQARDRVAANQGSDRLQHLDEGAEWPDPAHPLEALAVAVGPHEIFNVLRDDRHALELIQDMYAMSSENTLPGTVRMQDTQ